MSENKRNEVFSKEKLNELNEVLRENEKIELPDSLSKEKIEEAIRNVPQTEAPKEETRKKKTAYRILAVAASFAIVVSSVMLFNRNKPAEQIIKSQNGTVNDYAEIETLFAAYQKNYEKYNASVSLLNSVENVFNLGAKATDNAAYAYTADGNVKGNMANGAAVAESAAEGAAPTAQATENDHGETNEQVLGVHEADILKNDGKYLYAVMPQQSYWANYYGVLDDSVKTAESLSSVAIYEQLPDGNVRQVGKVNVKIPEGSEIYYLSISEMYVKDNTLLVLANGNIEIEEENVTDGDAKIDADVTFGYYYRPNKSVTLAYCFDISDKSNPKEMWHTVQDGYYVSSRLVDNELVLVTDYYVNLSLKGDALTKACIPEVYNGEEMTRVACEDICVMNSVCNSEYTLVSATDITKGTESYKVKAVLGGGSNVYCTTETLYVTNSVYSDEMKNDTAKAVNEIFAVSDDDASATQILKFDIRDCDVKYLGSGAVKGTALNQFSMDENNGYLRIATTTGFWGDSLENYVTVLDSELKQVGFIDEIAKGETIKSVRFTGNTGYVVTFEQTDPLFVIDLKDPTAPKITGELKIPGFSNYLHPVADGLLLGIGVDGDENGAGNGLKFSLFDVSDPKNPKEVSKYVISGQEYSSNTDGSYRSEYVSSPAFYDHKAVCWDEKNSIMYITFADENSGYVPNQTDYYQRKVGSLALFVNVDEKELECKNEYVTENVNGDYFDISRVTYTGDYVYNFDYYNGVLFGFNRGNGNAIFTETLS